MRLSGKVVVTGYAVGLGRAVATRFAQEGAAVVAVDINVQGGRAVMEDLPDASRRMAVSTISLAASGNLHYFGHANGGVLETRKRVA